MTEQPGVQDVFVSVILPVRNAADYIEQVLLAVERQLRPAFHHFEIVVVDDASADATVTIVEALRQRIENVQLYALTRPSGLDIALVAGLDNSIGDFVFTLNPQTDPVELIPALWRRSQGDGHEVVCGVRSDRLAGGIRSWANRTFYRVFEAATGLRVPLGISDLRLYSRRVVNYITQNNDRHLLLKVLPLFVSPRVGTVGYTPVRRGRERERSMTTALLSGITILLSSSVRPLRLLTLMSLMASSLSLAFAIYVLAVALLKEDVVEGWISLALPMAVMFFFVSTILGMLSEYIYMVAQQSGNRPVYTIAKEATSSVADLRQKLNVVDGSGGLAARGGRAGVGPEEP